MMPICFCGKMLDDILYLRLRNYVFQEVRRFAGYQKYTDSRKQQ